MLSNNSLHFLLSISYSCGIHHRLRQVAIITLFLFFTRDSCSGLFLSVLRISQQVYEVVPCQSDCGQYVWVAEPWSVWKVSNVDLKENCGEGVQTRKVRYDIIIRTVYIRV